MNRMIKMDKILFFEELSLNAHAAIKNKFYDGWILRFCEGHTKRANSVSPLYDTKNYQNEKINYCEAQYTKEGLPCVFKLTDKNSGLNTILEERGYEKLEPTDVMTMRPDAGFSRDIHEGYFSTAEPTEEWLSAYFEFEGITDKNRQELIRRMFSIVTADTLYGAVKADGKIVSCASAAIERGHMLLQNVVTDPDKRRMGFGRAVCKGLIRDAANCGTETAFLQVVQTNTAAYKMYLKLGYEKAYTYWYMRKAIVNQ